MWKFKKIHQIIDINKIIISYNKEVKLGKGVSVNNNFINRFIKEESEETSINTKKKVGVILLSIFTLIIAITTGCTKGSGNAEAPQQASPDTTAEAPATGNNAIPTDTTATPPTDSSNQGMVTVGNDGVKAGIAPDGVGIATDYSNDKMVSISMANSGRADPFLPAAEAGPAPGHVNPSKLPYLVLPPLEQVGADSTAEKVLTTKVSGIMYDNYSPSAILNIEGTDFLVRAGDVINNYKVLSISKSVVTVQLGSNVYRAGVGQLFSTDGLNYNQIANLKYKFGGARNRRY